MDSGYEERGDRMALSDRFERNEKSPLVDAYNLRGLPDSFVVDPEGYIIRRDLRGGEVLDYLSEVVTEYQNEF